MDKQVDEKKIVRILYTNHQGETSIRENIPLEIAHKSSDYHNEAQWLIRAIAIDRNAERHFACSEIKAWS